jgi:hypothetical protein
MGGIADHFGKARRVYQTGGLRRLLMGGPRFLAYCVFEYRSYWLYAEPTGNTAALDDDHFLPEIDDFRFEIVSSNQKADDLEADGFEFRSHVPNSRERLDKGAVAFCAFAGRELVSTNWVAMSQQAKDSLPEPPYRVDFSANEACVGDGWSNPAYRRMNLGVYRAFRTHRYMLEHGVVVKRIAFRKGSVWPEILAARIHRTRYGEGRYLRILWWKSWRERPLSTEEQAAVRQTGGPHS